MKSLKYAVILLLGLSMATMMSSCKKDNAQSIVGKWEATNRFRVEGAFVIHEGDKFTFTEGMTTFPFGMSLAYEVKGDNLWFYLEHDFDFHIDELTSTTLKLSWADNHNDDQCILKRTDSN